MNVFKYICEEVRFKVRKLRVIFRVIEFGFGCFLKDSGF